MRYIDIHSLVKRYGESELIRLAEIDDDELLEESEKVQRAIRDAEQIIDSYLRQRDLLPLDLSLVENSPIPLHASIIARYLLMDDLATEQAETNYKKAMMWLKDVATGRASLGELDPLASSAVSGPVIVQHSRDNKDWGHY